MSHVIYSRNSSNNELTPTEVERRAPAVFSDSQAPHLSQRYVALKTYNLIPVLADYGYVPVSAAQKKTRTTSVDHNLHMIAFAKASELGQPEAERSEIILYNDHSGKAATKLFAGMYRFICSNGIVAGEGFNSRITHTAKGMTGFEDMLRGTVAMLPQAMDTLRLLKAIKLDPDQVNEMVKRSVATRWAQFKDLETVKAGTYMTEELMRQVNTAQRIEDCDATAYTAFNRIQENIIRGNCKVLSIRNNKDIVGTFNTVQRKARPVNSVSENVRINRELWDIVTETVAA